MALDLVEALLRTQALRVAPPGEVFWYTSGTVGPYYIDTHFLCGGPQVATELLAVIDRERDDRRSLPAVLCRHFAECYARHEVYRAVIDLLGDALQAAGVRPSHVSGGERRDWFFSTALAARLSVPHLLLHKSGDWQVAEPDGTLLGARQLAGAQVAHVADLVTEASSYLRSWIPTVRRAGARMALSLNVVDRGQGGLAAIEAAGVPARALVRVDGELFDRLLAAGAIDATQHAMLRAYLADPRGSMRAFLLENPEFLRDALASRDPRIAARAQILLRENQYGLDLRSLGLG